ncbi:DNA-directed DNA polymerase [Infirmifilum sp. NZ]|uniref:DNA-directed DNA polymerase n=1 Tax=Infirmifilum sp. NZ TaxID=2926850 RepID=UPI0027AA3914|nr:DNA polymerase II [Infirmifilum sp. NZ]UNQ74341.1 DNA polymerase II [Infirmifilum sp. NZ]
MASEEVFWILDVNYEVVGGIPEVRLWGVSESGERIVVIDRSFRPYFYVLPSQRKVTDDFLRRVLSSLSGVKTLSVEKVERKYYGTPVEAVKVVLADPRDVPRARELVPKAIGVEEVLEADIRFYMRYMIDTGVKPSSWHIVKVKELERSREWRVDRAYLAVEPPKPIDEQRLPNLKIYAFDIECYNKFGEPNPDRDPVILISRATREGVETFEADGNDDERLIREFANDLLSQDPDVIVGYNSNRFDWPYLLARAHRSRMRLDVSRGAGEPAQSVYGHYSIVGRANIDLYDYASEIPEVKVKTLENVADYLGVVKKSERILIDPLSIYEYWDDPSKRDLLRRYNRDDAVSTFKLAEVVLPFAVQLSSLVGLPLDQVFAASVGNRVEWHLIRQAFLYGELVPNVKERPEETYRGAIVLKPKPGVHENIAVLDFSSMYPNIMIKYNVSPDTFVPPGVDVHPDEVYTAPEVGHRFRKNPPGFYAKVLSSLLEARRQIRDQMKHLDPKSEMYRILDERQKAIKVVTNATYGYSGWSLARWYMREVAEATTAWGRELIKSALAYAQKIGLYVLYGDTDSLFVKYDRGKVEELIRFVEKELGFEIKIDKVYSKVFFTEAKKRYCGLLEDGRIDVVGLEAVRGDWAEISKEIQEKVIEIVLREGDPWKAVEYVRAIIRDLELGKIPISKLIIWKTLSKSLDEYEVDAPHVRAAKVMVSAGWKVGKGSKIGYVIVKGGERVSEKALPFFLVKSNSEVDVEYYVKRQIVPAALRILEYFGIKEEHFYTGKRQQTLFDFMG